jgi:hypothetical protein
VINPQDPADLSLSLIPEPVGGGPPPPSPPLAFYVGLPGRVLNLRRVSTALPLPPPLPSNITASQALAAHVARGLLDSVLELAVASADCARAVAAAFPSNLSAPAVQSTTSVALLRAAGMCSNPCLQQLVEATSSAARASAAIWQTLQLSAEDIIAGVGGVKELRGGTALAVLADVVRAADWAFLTATVCATGPQGVPCSAGELDSRLIACHSTLPSSSNSPGTASQAVRALLYPGPNSTRIVPNPNQPFGTAPAICNAACTLALDDYAYEAGCCIATADAAAAAWRAVVYSHPVLGSRFRALWPGGSPPEEFRSPSPCPKAAAVAAAAGGGVDTACAAAGCGGSSAAVWPTAQCCDFGPPCANGGVKAWSGSCWCECPLGWAGALCNSDSPHSLFEVVLADFSPRQWFFGGATSFIATVAAVARVHPDTVEIERAAAKNADGNVRRVTSPSLRVRFRVLADSPSVAVRAAVVLGGTIQAGVFGAMLSRAGFGSGLAILEINPAVFNGSKSVCGGPAISCDAKSIASVSSGNSSINEASSNKPNSLIGDMVATAAAVIAVLGVALLARSKTLRSHAASTAAALCAFRWRSSKHFEEGANLYGPQRRKPVPRVRPVVRVVSDLVFLDVGSGETTERVTYASRNLKYVVIGADGNRVAVGNTPKEAHLAASDAKRVTAEAAAPASASVLRAKHRLGRASPAGGSSRASTPVIPYWSAGESGTTMVAVQRGSHIRSAESRAGPQLTGGHISPLTSTAASAYLVTGRPATPSAVQDLLLQRAASATSYGSASPKPSFASSWSANLNSPPAILCRRFPALPSTSAFAIPPPACTANTLDSMHQQLQQHRQPSSSLGHTPLALLRSASPANAPLRPATPSVAGMPLLEGDGRKIYEVPRPAAVTATTAELSHAVALGRRNARGPSVFSQLRREAAARDAAGSNMALLAVAAAEKDQE